MPVPVVVAPSSALDGDDDELLCCEPWMTTLEYHLDAGERER